MNLKRYQFEIESIINNLEELEQGRFFEVDRTPGVASAKTYAKNIKGSFLDLMEKIHDDKPGAFEKLDID